MHTAIVDDSGIFEVFKLEDYENEQEMLVNAIDHLIEWFDPDENETYDVESCELAIEQLTNERNAVVNGLYDLSDCCDVFNVFGFEFKLG